MSEALASIASAVYPLICPLTIGGIGGFFAGYAVKKVLKIAMLLGVFAFAIAYMVYTNVISIDTSQLTGTLSGFADRVGSFGLTPLISTLPFIASFAVGFILGMKKS